MECVGFLFARFVSGSMAVHQNNEQLQEETQAHHINFSAIDDPNVLENIGKAMKKRVTKQAAK